MRRSGPPLVARDAGRGRELGAAYIPGQPGRARAPGGDAPGPRPGPRVICVDGPPGRARCPRLGPGRSLDPGQPAARAPGCGGACPRRTRTTRPTSSSPRARTGRTKGRVASRVRSLGQPSSRNWDACAPLPGRCHLLMGGTEATFDVSRLRDLLRRPRRGGRLLVVPGRHTPRAGRRLAGWLQANEVPVRLRSAVRGRARSPTARRRHRRQAGPLAPAPADGGGGAHSERGRSAASRRRCPGLVVYNAYGAPPRPTILTAPATW